MATSDTTGLVKNTDFSADLLLNKVMNQQYRTQNGNTLTLAGRVNASKLDTTAKTYGIQAENLAKASTVVNATQDALSEMVDIAKKAQSAAIMTDSAARGKLAKELLAQLGQVSLAQVDSLDVFSATASVGLGLGTATAQLGLGSDGAPLFAGLSSALGSMGNSTWAPSASSLIDTSLENLLGQISVEGAKAALIDNRYQTLNDLALSYKDASDNQVVAEGGSSTSLLNNLL